MRDKKREVACLSLARLTRELEHTSSVERETRERLLLRLSLSLLSAKQQKESDTRERERHTGERDTHEREREKRDRERQQ